MPNAAGSFYGSGGVFFTKLALKKGFYFWVNSGIISYIGVLEYLEITSPNPRPNAQGGQASYNKEGDKNTCLFYLNFSAGKKARLKLTKRK
jgi:hypothetical protein